MSWSTEFVARLLEAQRAEYVQALPDKLAQLDALWAQAGAGGGAAGEALAGLERLAHGVYGTAGSLGLVDLGEAAGELEQALQALRAAPEGGDHSQQLRVTQAGAAVRTAGLAAAWLSRPVPP